jgi:hypothetical protein
MLELKKIFEKEKFTTEQYNGFEKAINESINKKDSSIAVSFLSENLSDVSEDEFKKIAESVSDKIIECYKIIEEKEKEENILTDSNDKIESPSKEEKMIQDMFKEFQESNSQFQFQIKRDETTPNSIFITVMQDDENRTDSFTVSGAKGHKMADFKNWFEEIKQLYTGGLTTNRTYEDGLAAGKKLYPDLMVMTKEEKETDYGKGLTEAWNAEYIKEKMTAKKGDEIIDPLTYATPVTGKTKSVKGDDDTVSDDPKKMKKLQEGKDKDKKDDDDKEIDEKCSSKKKKMMESKDKKDNDKDEEEIEEKVKKPEGVELKEYDNGYNDGYIDSKNKKDPHIDDADESDYGKGYKKGYKDHVMAKESKEIIGYDDEINEKINRVLNTDIEEFICEKTMDILKGTGLADVMKAIEESTKPVLTREKYRYVVERFVESLHKHSINNVVLINEESMRLTNEDFDNILNEEESLEESMKRNYPAYMEPVKGKENEGSGPNFGGAETTVSDNIFADFKKKMGAKVMAYAEAKTVFEKMFNVKIMPEGEAEFKTALNNEGLLDGDGKSTNTISDRYYEIYAMRAKAMAWDDAKDMFQRMFNIKLMPTAEDELKSMLMQDDLLGGTGKSDNVVSDKVISIGAHTRAKSNLQEEVVQDVDNDKGNEIKKDVSELKESMSLLAKNLTMITESMGSMANTLNSKKIEEERIRIIDENIKDMPETDKIRFKKIAEAVEFKSKELFEENIKTMKGMFIKEEKEHTTFKDRDLLMSELERKYRNV